MRKEPRNGSQGREETVCHHNLTDPLEPMEPTEPLGPAEQEEPAELEEPAKPPAPSAAETDAEAQRLAEVLGRMGAKLVLLFGSRARGEAPGPDSDLDLLVVMESGEPDLLKRRAGVLEKLDPKIRTDLTVLTPGDFDWIRVYDPVVRTALLEGTILHGSLEAVGLAPGSEYEPESEPARPSVVAEHGTGGRDDRAPWASHRERELAHIRELDTKLWIARAKEDLDACKLNDSGGFYALACYLAHQTVEKALKAFLFWNGRGRIKLHWLKDLAAAAVAIDPSLGALADKVKPLDPYYLETRYPDAPRRPGRKRTVFNKKTADDALEVAESVLDLVVRKLGKVGQSSFRRPDETRRRDK